MSRGLRLQVYLARCGVASRRKAEELILQGRVQVNGRTVTLLGTRVDPDTDEVLVDGKRVEPEQRVYVLLNKPRGYVSSTAPEGDIPPVTALVQHHDVRLFPVGRLDVSTEGALLLTNDGKLAQALTHPSRKVAKKYLVRIRGHVSEEDLGRLLAGVELEDGLARADSLGVRGETKSATWLEIQIHEGRNRMIRRMFEALGYQVARLIRIEFAGLRVDDLPPGGYRPLTTDELRALRRLTGANPRRPSRRKATRPRPGSRRRTGTRKKPS